MSNKSPAMSPLPGHTAQRHLSSEGNDSRETCHSPLKAMGETEGGEEIGERNELGSLQTLVPFHIQAHHPSQ